MKKKFILAAIILFLICTNIFSQTDPIVKCSSNSQVYVAENLSEKSASAASWKISSSAVNAKDNTINDNVNVVRGAGIKTTGDYGTITGNVFFYVPLVIIYTVGQLLLLFFIIYERRFKNKNNPSDIYTIVDKECLIL